MLPRMSLQWTCTIRSPCLSIDRAAGRPRRRRRWPLSNSRWTAAPVWPSAGRARAPSRSPCPCGGERPAARPARRRTRRRPSAGGRSRRSRRRTGAGGCQAARAGSGWCRRLAVDHAGAPSVAEQRRAEPRPGPSPPPAPGRAGCPSTSRRPAQAVILQDGPRSGAVFGNLPPVSTPAKPAARLSLQTGLQRRVAAQLGQVVVGPGDRGDAELAPACSDADALLARGSARGLRARRGPLPAR